MRSAGAVASPSLAVGTRRTVDGRDVVAERVTTRFARRWGVIGRRIGLDGAHGEFLEGDARFQW